ncbi:MAG: RNB domain-containing ribonuclease [Gemmatimonadaceae bacterium]
MPHPIDLRAASHQALIDSGFIDIPPAAVAEVEKMSDALGQVTGDVQDLTRLPWSSIDNDSSRDLDQLEVADKVDGGVRVRIAIADVDAMVPKGSETDKLAAANSTSVYTGIAIYPMLPERLSTDLTSLREGVDREAVVIEFTSAPDGTIKSHSVYLARVHNYSKLAYGGVGAWLDGHGVLPLSATQTIQDQLHLQDDVSDALRAHRAKVGALDLETIEAQSVVHSDDTVSIELIAKTRASHLIEDFMIAANVAMAQFLDEHKSPSIRRVVRTPERWNKIVALAAGRGEKLPVEADSKALEVFLAKERLVDPDHFADLSLAIVKLIGPGEYALHIPGGEDAGHFGLATHDYTHSTAPNRRFADLVTQRLVKAVLAGKPCPYTNDELDAIARHCTEREDAARRVERQVRKIAGAVSMADHIGDTFDAIVTGVVPKGTFVRLIHPPVEGRVTHGEHGLNVGDRTRVKLLSTDPVRGFIDFEAINSQS